MAKYAIDCPHCGTVNTASTFVLAKKVIKCGKCNQAINTKTMRMASKQCPHCEKIYVYDQSKGRYSQCPSCGTSVDNADSYGRKQISINCPQCSCEHTLVVGDTQKTLECPICSYEIDIDRELTRAKLVSDTGISVLQYEGDNSTFVWKHPIEDFNLGSQLIVHESQEAVFFLNGAALDTFGPGRHTLETENLPVLKKFYSLPTGSQTPFHAEVYFINKTVQLGMKWGTDSRVRFIEPATGIPLDIGASGEMSLQVSDSRKLLFKLVGTAEGLSGRQILSVSEKKGGQKTLSKGWKEDEHSFEESGQAQKALRGFFRAPLMTEVKTYLAAVIKEQQINIFEIDSHMGELSAALRERISPKFEEYGLTIPQFYITNIALPEEDKNFKDLRSLVSQAYIGVKKQEVATDIAEAERRRKIVEEQTEAQLRMIRAQAEAEAAKARGLAQAEVMQAQGYSQKDVLAADVQKAYAEGMGNMGGSGGSTGAGLAADLVGMMAGMKMAGNLFEKMDGAIFPAGDNPAGASANALARAQTWACACGERDNTKQFCMSCGAPRPQAQPQWNCPQCGAEGIRSRHCPECGTSRPPAQPQWNCPQCGAEGISSRHCPECGASRPKAQPQWSCPQCGKNITSKFCPECGVEGLRQEVPHENEQ